MTEYESKGSRLWPSWGIVLTSNEWDKARRWREKYWLYAVEEALTNPQLTPIRNPFEALKDMAEMVPVVTYKWIIKKW